MNSFVRQFAISMAISSAVYFAVLKIWPPTQPVKDNTPQTIRKLKEINKTNRIYLRSKLIDASINKHGAKLDFLQFKQHTTGEGKPVTFLYPENSKKEFFTCLKFIGDDMPNTDDIWKTAGDKLIWKNDVWKIEQFLELKGYRIIQHVEITNLTPTGRKAIVASYIRRKKPKNINSIGHEGLFIANRSGIKQITYDDSDLHTVISRANYSGWTGITDRYWNAAILLENASASLSKLSANTVECTSPRDPLFLQPKETKTLSFDLFIGPKDMNILDFEQGGNGGLDLTIDYGWFSFITKPLAYLIYGLKKHTGSMALALIIFAIISKLAFLPITIRAQRAMQAMKILQPHIKQIQEQYKDSPKVLQLRLLELYKEHKINPLSGCLPVVIQLLLFFPIYRVLNILLYIRNEPFYGWITDLSAPDPTSWYNLFGLLPWEPLAWFSFGLWPLLMGVSFFAQQYDSNNKHLSIMFLVISIFMSASIPVCITIYWTLTNIMNVLQNHLPINKLFGRHKYGYL